MEDLSKTTFFSKKNIKIIQQKIKDKIKEKTNGKIILTVDQDELDLNIIMNKIYYKALEQNINSIDKLNNIVVKSIVPEMIINIKQSLNYKETIDKNTKPLPRPINVNRVSKKTLPSITTTFKSI